jgi:hypothetical protein
MEPMYFAEMSVHFQQTTRRYVPKYRILHKRRCEHLKFVLHFLRNFTLSLSIHAVRVSLLSELSRAAFLLSYFIQQRI